MATCISPVTQFSESPYITVAEYKNAPTALDINNLVNGGNSAAQDAELQNVINRASSFMDEFLNQNLCASTQTESQRTRFTPEGYISLHTNEFPIVALTSFSYGATPNSLNVLSDCSTAWFEPHQIIIPISQINTSYSSQGPLSFGGAGSSSRQIYVKYTYVSGFVNNLISTATATQSTMTVQTPDGIVAGMSLRIYDGANSETVTVGSTYVFNSTTVPLVSPLAYTHASGVAFGNMPNSIKQACILITSALIKVRGDSSMTMQMSVNPIRQQGNNASENMVGNDLTLALKMVDLYRRIR